MSIGIHCDRLGKTLECALEDVFVKMPKSECVQIFTHGPRSSALTKFDPHEIGRICQTKKLYIHQTYATSWAPTGLQHMKEQYQTACDLGAEGIVFHLGKITPQEHLQVLETLIDPLKPTKILLEMRALKPSKWSYTNQDELLELAKEIELKKLDHLVQLCVDTAHISSGLVRLKTERDCREYFEALTPYVGLIHLNGNQYDPLVRAGDKHTLPLAKDDFVFTKESLEWVLNYALDNKKDIIVECDFGDDLVEFINQFL